MKTLLTTVALVATMSTSAFATNYVAEMQKCYMGTDAAGNAIADYNCAIFTALDAQNELEAKNTNSIEEIAEVIEEHNPKNAQQFRNNPAQLVDNLYGYIWKLRGQLGLD